MLAAKQQELRGVVEQINKVHKRWGGTSSKLLPWAEKIEVATRSTAVDFIRGGYKTFPERQRTAFLNRHRFEEYAIEVLQDRQLVKDWIEEMTTLDIPTGPHALERMLWEMMHGQDREALATLNPNNPQQTKTRVTHVGDFDTAELDTFAATTTPTRTYRYHSRAWRIGQQPRQRRVCTRRRGRIRLGDKRQRRASTVQGLSSENTMTPISCPA